MFGKQKFATLVAEFLGAGVLTLVFLSVQYSSIGVPFFVATSAGLTVALMIFALRGASLGYFNPAIALAMWTARKLSTITAALYVAVELLGAWAAYGLYTYFANRSLQTIGGHYTTRILIAEAVGTAVFAFGFAAAVYHRNTAAATAAFAGLAFLLGIVVASPASLGLLNPAVALGVRSWVWGTYVLGPVVGAVVGVNLYDLLFAAKGESSSVLNALNLSSSSTTSSPTKAKKSTKKSK